MIDVIIPAAGDGTRFMKAGYIQPKPMIDVLGKPMIQRVIENLRPKQDNRIILISKLHTTAVRDFLEEDDIDVQLGAPTEGAVDTILKARDYLDESPLLIGNCDQLVDFDVNKFIEDCVFSEMDGSIVTFKSNKPHHSYVHIYKDELTQEDVVQQIKEKQVISHHAVTGVYYFSHGSDFLKAADDVMRENVRFRNEYYVSSVIAKMIEDGFKFVTYDAPSAMLGTPEELQLFELAVKVGKTL